MGGTELYADDYCLIAGDLREFTTLVVDRLIQHGFDTRSANAQPYEYFTFILSFPFSLSPTNIIIHLIINSQHQLSPITVYQLYFFQNAYLSIWSREIPIKSYDGLERI